MIKKINKQQAKKYSKKIFDRYIIDAFTGMAKGLFVTLIAGTILELIGKGISLGSVPLGNFVITISKIAKMLMGVGIGIGIALQFKCNPIVIVTAAIAGMVGSFSYEIVGQLTGLISSDKIEKLGALAKVKMLSPGDPIGAYVVSVISIELGQHISKKIKLAVIGLPLFMFVYMAIGVFIAYPFVLLFKQIAKLIEVATTLAPFTAGLVISITMGILLTMPTSSAAIWISFALGNNSPAMLLAGGAACAGCACHMIGFAVASYRENGWRGLLAQGLGTSMLQIPNIMKNPAILYPAVISSAISGPFATVAFGLRSTAFGGGMGTSGLVGVIETISASKNMISTVNVVLGILVCFILIPTIVSFTVSEILRNYKVIKFGDMKI